ncbi:MAG: gliding motility protein GldH [Chitinophagaceae bacterium]|nr:gliding motility protein GldH [Chitinophagaceae bacterium]
MKRSVLVVITALVIFSACTTNGVYEKLAFFPRHEWRKAQVDSFRFSVTDSSLYKVYFVFRHADAYRWQNIWLNMQVRKNTDSAIRFKSEFILSDNFKWLGTAVDDIIEHRLLFDTLQTRQPATYTFTIQQVMREDPLPHVLNAGIRVEKIQ